MSHQTVSTIAIVLSSLVLAFSVFNHVQFLRNKDETSKVSPFNIVFTILVVIFWVSLLVGGILLRQEKDLSVLILYASTYLMLTLLLIKLIYSLITFFKVKSGKSADEEMTVAAARKSVLVSVVQFVIISVIMTWFQNWLNLLTF